MKCKCGKEIPSERYELGYHFCTSCVENDLRLVKKTPVIVHGQHKGQNLVSRPDQTIANYKGSSCRSEEPQNKLPNAKIARKE